jgi:hypothetical protein
MLSSICLRSNSSILFQRAWVTMSVARAHHLCAPEVASPPRQKGTTLLEKEQFLLSLFLSKCFPFSIEDFCFPSFAPAMSKSFRHPIIQQSLKCLLIPNHSSWSTALCICPATLGRDTLFRSAQLVEGRNSRQTPIKPSSYSTSAK